MNGWPYFAYSLCVGVLIKGKGYKTPHKTHKEHLSHFILFTDFMFMFKFKSLALCFYTVKEKTTNQQTKTASSILIKHNKHFIIRS